MILRQAVAAVPLVLLSTFLVFALTQVLPGDAALILAGPDPTAATVEAIRRDRGIGVDERPIPVRYADWLGRVARGDLGRSIYTDIPVAETLLAHLGPTVELALAGTLLTVLLAVPLGSVAAARAGARTDAGIRMAAALVAAVPPFWMGLLLLIGAGAALAGWPLVLPTLTLALPAAASLARLVRALVLDSLGEEWVTVARAKGLPGRQVLLRHALRPQAGALVTLVGLSFARLLGGAMIVEALFSRQGLGLLFVRSVTARDYPVIQGAMLLFLLALLVVGLAVDRANAHLDPRRAQ
ncbi:MAG: ABC transporter permease [Chloroflexi bacterium]|nr:ABC transporter permease [Chloroflexota bacterium]